MIQKLKKDMTEWIFMFTFLLKFWTDDLKNLSKRIGPFSLLTQHIVLLINKWNILKFQTKNFPSTQWVQNTLKYWSGVQLVKVSEVQVGIINNNNNTAECTQSKI